MAAVWRYDPSRDRWEARRPMPSPRGALAVVALNGKLYAIGGKADQVVTANEEYDPAANVWRRRAPMPTGRDHLAAVALGKKVYVMGGRVGLKPKRPATAGKLQSRRTP